MTKRLRMLNSRKNKPGEKSSEIGTRRPNRVLVSLAPTNLTPTRIKDERKEGHEIMVELTDKSCDTGSYQETCGGCLFWSGSCSKGRLNRVAADEACEIFEPRKKGETH